MRTYKSLLLKHELKKAFRFDVIVTSNSAPILLASSPIIKVPSERRIFRVDLQEVCIPLVEGEDCQEGPGIFSMVPPAVQVSGLQ